MNYRNCSLFTQTWVSYSRKREKCVTKEKIKIDMQVKMVVFLDTFFRGLEICHELLEATFGIINVKIYK